MYNDDFYKYLQRLETNLRELSDWSDLYQQQMHTIDLLMTDANRNINILIECRPLIKKQSEFLQAWIHSKNLAYLQNTLTMQMDALLQARQSVDTPALKTLLDHFRHADWTRGMEEFMQAMSEPFTEAANVAFLCNTESLNAILPASCPSGMKTFVRSIRKRTAKRLAETAEIEVNCKDKIFRPVHNPDCAVNVKSMNLLASTTELFAEIREEELMELMDALARTPEFASNCSAGRKIWEIIREWNNFIDFDQEYFYHARAMADNGCPFTSLEMGKAPNFSVSMGRFNHVGQGHYYFSDKEEGARIEVNRHNRGARVQIARLKPCKSIRLLDLSEEITTNNMFLQYIRFSSSGGNAPREYLIPCYVASCCSQVHIDGIKYYGSKEYKNYVSWNDGYFDVETTWEL